MSAGTLIHRAMAVGPLQCNCHLLADERTKEAVVIDPGDDADAIVAMAEDLGVAVKAILHTHCHFDHITGTRRLKEATGAAIHIHARDRALYEGLKAQYSEFFHRWGMDAGTAADPLPADGLLKDGQTFPLGGHAIRVLHTPGHTPGSCCFGVESPRERLVFSGDTLFAGSIGRTDLPGGDLDQELQSIRAKLLTLDPGTVVFPGHGPATRIRDEKTHNPFLA